MARAKNIFCIDEPTLVRAHPAVSALEAALPGWHEPHAVFALKGPRRNGEGGVFRLTGPASIVAKHAVGSGRCVERLFYETIAPSLGPLVPRFLGVHHEGDGLWLFLEDVQGERANPRDPKTRRTVAEAVARLHRCRIPPEVRKELPDRGVSESMKVAMRARDRLRGAAPRLRPSDRGFLAELCDLLLAFEAAACRLKMLRRRMATTLVHFDGVPKNVLVADDARVTLIDWEWVGMGPPEIDYHRWDLAAYTRAMGWPDARLASMRCASRIGSALYTIRSIEWDAAKLQTPWPDRALRHLWWYRDQLRSFLADLEQLES